MRLRFDDTWELSSEQVGSLGRLLLVNQMTNATYGPGDLVPTDPAGFMPADRVAFYLYAENCADGRVFTSEEDSLLFQFQRSLAIGGRSHCIIGGSSPGGQHVVTKPGDYGRSTRDSSKRD